MIEVICAEAFAFAIVGGQSEFFVEFLFEFRREFVRVPAFVILRRTNFDDNFD